jgi:ATP-dependent DNA helicase RecQ
MQEEIVDDSINGHDVLALLPTGGGKSICFQVPGLAREGVTIVISPLIALMQDQVLNLEKAGIRAKAITSGMSYRDIDITLDNARFGGLDFLYTSPERLKTPLFIERYKRMQVGLIVVDEAHCISEWGHDFRPAFMSISDLREIHPEVPFLALTATANEKVRADIIEKLKLHKPQIHEASFERKNLTYSVYKSENKIQNIIDYCKKTDEVGIVYCQTRKSVKDVAKILIANGINCGVYHGGMNADERSQMLNFWLSERIKIIVATNAFGMGIDKPNVRFVLHYEIPASPEAYFQEAGRGGRDGTESIAIAYYAPNDGSSLLEQIEKNYPEKEAVIHCYRAICNHLKIAIGSGKDESYPIDLKYVCKQFNLEYAVLYNSLKLLESNGNILLSEGFYHPTKIRFTVENRDLYNFQISHEKFYPITSILTRSYSGVFDTYQAINESEICKRLKISEQEFKKQIDEIQKFGILDVNWRSNLPSITLLIERLADADFSLKPEIYHDRKITAIDKANYMLLLCEGEKCRAQLLIGYFGQQTNECGKCDACLTKYKNKNLNEKELIEFLQKPTNMQEVKGYFRSDEDELNSMLRKLVKEERVRYENGNYKAEE